MEYPEIIGKTITAARSWIEGGMAYLELTFNDQTSFSYQSTANPKVWARTYNCDGEVLQER